MVHHIFDLPPHLHESIFKWLQFKDLDTVRSVCQHFHDISIIRMAKGIEHVLDNLAHKMAVLEVELRKVEDTTLEDKITLNQTLTTLKLLRMHVYSLYVLRRHYLLPKCYFTPFGSILDNITKQLQQMKINNCLSWLHNCLSLQNIIARFNIYNGNMSGNMLYPFGVHVIDILDVLTGINYDIQCVYNFDNNSCNVNAYYFTENVKFLTYMPEINFIKNCQDRYLTPEERTSILKYLLALVNLYNGLYGKKEEYEREMQFANNHSNVTNSSNDTDEHHQQQQQQSKEKHSVNFSSEESHCYRKVKRREYLNPSRTCILEHYQNQCIEQKALLGCKVNLACSMDAAPFKIMKSCELLKRDLYLSDSGKVDAANDSTNSKDIGPTKGGKGKEKETSKAETVNYAVDIKLQFVLTHKMQELFDISIKDVDF